jgi:predicted nucleic acid-binding protein
VRVLLDTNVVSELRKPPERCDPAVRSWFVGLPESSIYLSVLVLGELRRGVERLRRRDTASAEALDHWLQTLAASYSGRILGIDAPVAEVWGRINVPEPLPAIDGLIAATALAHGLTLATRNVRDLLRSGVPIVNPWDSARG